MPSRRLATPCRGGNLNLPLQVTSLLSPCLSSLPEPLHRHPTVPSHQLYNALAVLLICSMLLRAEPLPARTSFPPAMLYQCATVVLQCSCSSLPLQCSQFPVPCQPACVLNRINHILPPHYNHTAVPGHFNPDRHSPRLALYQFEPV